MNVRIGGILDNSLANGEGLRTVIFFAGCYHGCDECHNEHLWDMNSGELVNINEITNIIDKNLPLISGITMSGGEPFLQPYALLEILKYAKNKGLNTWVYTGYIYEDIKMQYHTIFKYIDVLVDGRFVKDLKDPSLKFRGSSNQRIIRLKENNYE